jgi:hypothetical protein
MAIRQATILGGPGPGDFEIRFSYDDRTDEITRFTVRNQDDVPHQLRAIRSSDGVEVLNVRFLAGYNDFFDVTGMGFAMGLSPKGSPTLAGYELHYS